jgi:hypothetical protein
MEKHAKYYKVGGCKGNWWLQWTDGGAWKTLPYQYKGDLNRAEKCFKEQGYQLQEN